MLPCVWFSNRSQMTSKCGKNKKVAHEAIAECVTDVLTTFWRLLWSITESDARQHGIYLFYIITKSLFCSKYFNITRKPAFCPAFARKKPFDVIYDIQNETISLVAMRSKELWLVEKNHAAVKLDSSVASRGMKTYSESRIELRKSTISWRKCWIRLVSFCHQSSPVSRRAWMLPWILLELKKYARKTCALDPSFAGTQKRASNGGNLCPLWSVILKSVWNSVGDTF